MKKRLLPTEMFSRVSFSVVVQYLLTITNTMIAGEYNDSSGFSFSYPEGWFAASKVNPQNDKIPPELNKWIAKNNIDLDKIRVAVIRGGQDDFLENMNVVVVPKEIPVNDQSLNELLGGLQQQYRTLGIAINKLDGSVQQIGDNKVILLNYESRLPAIPFLLRQRQMYVPGGGQSYIVTCTGKVDAFATYSPVFDSILASMKVPASTQTGFDWQRVIIFAIVGGVLAAGFSLVKKLF